MKTWSQITNWAAGHPDRHRRTDSDDCSCGWEVTAERRAYELKNGNVVSHADHSDAAFISELFERVGVHNPWVNRWLGREDGSWLSGGDVVRGLLKELRECDDRASMLEYQLDDLNECYNEQCRWRCGLHVDDGSDDDALTGEVKR